MESGKGCRTDHRSSYSLRASETLLLSPLPCIIMLPALQQLKDADKSQLKLFLSASAT